MDPIYCWIAQGAKVRINALFAKVTDKIGIHLGKHNQGKWDTIQESYAFWG